ncbi:MAG: AAA family ATPase, partial [Clostridiales bacterium]|nr:AAA family ATPase [Clostridiales bacterium]
MLLSFSVSNYKSINEEICIDFRAASGLSEGDKFCFDVNNVKVLPVISLYGANASGKSNIIEAMQNMFWTMENSNKLFDNVNSVLYPHKPFLLDDDSKGKPTTYGVEFAIGEYCYTYRFSYYETEVQDESLFRNKLSKRETRPVLVFERTKDKPKYGRIFTSDFEKPSIINDNVLLLTVLGGLNKKSIFHAILRSSDSALPVPLNFHERYFGDYGFTASLYYTDAERTAALQQFLIQFDPTIEKI